MMNQNLKTFIAIFFFISGAVGIVLCFANLSQQPVDAPAGVLFGIVGAAGLIAGWLMVRKPKY
jgi:uncharacterized membrane protein HdeD (DUF308 family)